MLDKRYRFIKKKRFNAFIIKGWQIVAASIAIVIFAVTAFCVPFPSIGEELLLPALRFSLPRVSESEKADKSTLSKILSDIYPQRVLAEAIPFLYLPPPEEEIEYDEPIADNTEPSPVLPENTFPIQNSQVISKNLAIRNETTYAPDLTSLLASPLDFKSPEILIVHTHASESYSKDGATGYAEGESDRTLDTSLNMVRVGEELSKELASRGFKVTHARDINDHPSYNQSYNRTLKVIENHISANPNIAIVLDLHRDAAIKSDGTKLKFTSVQNGEKVAQVMLVCGTNQRGLPNDNWQENLKFALKLQNYMENTFPGFARPLNLRQERFNTHATKGSIIIEIGTSGNTLQESLNSVKYLADALTHVIPTNS